MANKKKLKNYITDKEVCIGAKDGTNFMYIGPFNEETVETIDSLFELYYEQMKFSIPGKYKTFETALASLKKLDMKENDVEETLTTLRTVAGNYSTYASTKKYVKNYKPVFERDIVEVRDRITDDRVILMIEGSEKGKYWTREEYLNDKKKGKIEEETE